VLNRTEKKITSDEQAVSEVMGVVLLVGIVVIMLSVLGVSVFAQDGPDDVPHTNVQEIMDTSTDTIYLKHNGGEPISTEDAEIIVNINGRKYEYNSSQIYENLGNSSVWKIGDTIEINTMSTWTVNLQNNDRVELFLVDTPSNELIQKSRLTTRFQNEPKFTITLTPMGEITDTSSSAKDESKKGYGKKWQSRIPDGESNPNKEIQKDKENRNCTTYYPPLEGEINTSIYQEFDFGIKPTAYGIRPGDTFVNVTLIIVYYTHDASYSNFKLKFYDTDEHGHGEWVYYKEDLPEHNSIFEPEFINLTDYIYTPTDLANFKVRIEAVRDDNQANSEKEIMIDYMGLWVEEDNTESE
jgi:FlaG/FlaF family flagellin (archaellin)